MKTPSHRFTIPSFTNAARIASVTALIAGCGIVKVQGLGGAATPTSSARAGSETTPPAGAKGGEARPAAEADAELVKAYLAITWKGYPARYRDPGAIKAMHLTAVDGRGKPRFASTPDVAWLPGWNPGQSDSIDLPFQVAQAGINRTWLAACFADYAAYRAGWNKLAATLRPKLDAARAVANFYERTAALRELYAATGAAAAAQHVELPMDHPGHWAGLRWEISRELMLDGDRKRSTTTRSRRTRSTSSAGGFARQTASRATRSSRKRSASTSRWRRPCWPSSTGR